MDDRLLTCIAKGRAPHAILLAGPEGSGRVVLARRAAAIYCRSADAPDRLLNCPNYCELAGANVGVAQVRDLMAMAAAQSFNGGRRAFVLTDAHRMAPQSQNALLKTLEEPPTDTLLILTGNEPGLLPTIRSRCMIWRMGARPLDEVAGTLKEAGADETTAQLCARASDGVPGLAKMFASESGAAFRKEALELLEQALFRAPPFSAMEALLLEETAKEGRKRRPDADKLRSLLLVWGSALRDAQAVRCAMPEAAWLNADSGRLTSRIAARFTDAQIQGMIEMLGQAARQLSYRANPGLVIDTVLAKFCAAD